MRLIFSDFSEQRLWELSFPASPMSNQHPSLATYDRSHGDALVLTIIIVVPADEGNVCYIVTIVAGIIVIPSIDPLVAGGRHACLEAFVGLRLFIANR